MERLFSKFHSLHNISKFMRETLADLAGGPLSDWAWQKASLPISFGGLNLRSANLHVPAAFISSLAQSKPLMAGIMVHPVTPSTYLTEAVSMLADAAKMDDWLSVDDIDVPIRQQAYCLIRSTKPVTTLSLLPPPTLTPTVVSTLTPKYS